MQYNDYIYIYPPENDSAFRPKGKMVLDETAAHTVKNVRAQALSENTIFLSWQKSSASDVDHYNVYCGSNPAFMCTQANLIGSPGEIEFVDWGLQPNSDYWYRLTAVDRAGNESKPTKSIYVKTPPLSLERIVLNADNLKSVSDLKIASSDSAGGKIIKLSHRNKKVTRSACAVWAFEIKTRGEYAIWGRSTHWQKKDVSFELKLDDEPPIRWEVWGLWGQWLWSPAGRKIAASPELFYLNAGKHVLKVKPMTPYSQISEMVITNDPTWYPVKWMNFVKGYSRFGRYP